MCTRFALATILSLGLVLGAACGSDDDDGATGDASPGQDGAPGDAGSDPDAAAPMARLMYISTGGGNSVKVATLEADGTMTEMAALEVDLGGLGGAMAYARTARRLYVGTGNSIATLSLDASGAPAVIGSTPATQSSTYITMANNDEDIVKVSFSGATIRSYDVTGTPPHPLNETLDTDIQPHAAYVGPSGLIYVPHRDAQTTHYYSIDATGDLTLVDQVASAAGVGPRHIAFTPNGEFAYVVNEQGDSVTAHSVAQNGVLTPLDTITTLPAGVDGANNNCADIHVTPDGNYVYASNRGHDSLAMFSIGSDGNLTAMGTVATEATPREFDVSPDGAYVVVAGQGTGFLQSYRVGADGMLTAITTGTGVGRLDVGNDPRWVIID